MELLFELTTNVGAGINPAAIHLPDNSVWLFTVKEGRLRGARQRPGSGDVNWAMPEFKDIGIVNSDRALVLYQVYLAPRIGVFGLWQQNSVIVNNAILVPGILKVGMFNIEKSKDY